MKIELNMEKRSEIIDLAKKRYRDHIKEVQAHNRNLIKIWATTRTHWLFKDMLIDKKLTVELTPREARRRLYKLGWGFKQKSYSLKKLVQNLVMYCKQDEVKSIILKDSEAEWLFDQGEQA